MESWTLRGAGGVELEAMTYGGIVSRLMAPDRDGLFADVVLGFDSLEEYLAGHPYFGAIVGRVAGRIGSARFAIDEKTYSVCCNQPPNHLHGGLRGFDKKIWNAAPKVRPDGAPSLRLTASSPDGEEGYPGNLQVEVTYTVTNNNVFLFETSATTDQPTPVSIAHHSYFNLAGEGSGPVDDHEIQVHASEFVPVDRQMTLLGRIESVSCDNNDFRIQRVLGSAMPTLFEEHGDLYRLRPSSLHADDCALIPAARLVHPKCGRVLDVSTTEAYLQLYTGSALDGSLRGKSGACYGRHAGICFECQGYPGGTDAPHMGNIILRSGQKLSHITAYAFSTVARPSSASAGQRDISGNVLP